MHVTDSEYDNREIVTARPGALEAVGQAVSRRASHYEMSKNVEILSPGALARIRWEVEINKFRVNIVVVRGYKGCPLCRNEWLFHCRCWRVSCIAATHQGPFECPVCGDVLETEDELMGHKRWSIRSAEAPLPNRALSGTVKKESEGLHLPKLAKYLRDQQKKWPDGK